MADLRRQIPLVLDVEAFRQGVEELDRELVQKRERIMGEVLISAAQKQLSIVRASAGLAVVPIANGQPIPPELFAQMPENQRQVIEHKRQKLQRELKAAASAEQAAEKETTQAKHSLEVDLEHKFGLSSLLRTRS